MPLITPPLLVVVIASIAAMTWAGATDARVVSALAAALAALVLIVTAYNHNRPAAADTAPTAPNAIAATNARLMAAVYGWGGLAMLAVYLLSGLAWRHGWQYGSGMLLIAAGLLIYARQVTDLAAPLAKPGALALGANLALAQAVAASVALVILMASGKLDTRKGDWAANHIFLAGGLAIVAVSLLAYATHRRLGQNQ